MIDIIVMRGKGSNPGADIVDPLLSTLEVALARGRSELDTHAAGQQPVTLEVVSRAGLRNGQLVEVHDALQGTSYRGKVTNVAHRVSGPAIVSRVDILKHTGEFL